MRQRHGARALHGFTLIELLVAIAVMALLSLVSWRGLDSMSRATSQNQQRADAVLTLQATLAQWGADLDAVTKSLRGNGWSVTMHWPASSSLQIPSRSRP